MGKKQKSSSDRSSGEVLVKTHKVEQIDIYEVTENELFQLENGTNSDLYLEFSISLLSIFVSMLATLLTAIFNNNIVLNIFISITVISLILGGLLLLLWYRNRKEKKAIIENIKSRKEKEK